MKFDIIVFIVSSDMVLVRVPILFNGEWIEQNDEYKLKGSKAKWNGRAYSLQWWMVV